MLYDAMQLEKQVRDLASQHRKEGKTGTSEEYLSDMKKEDRLSPVITLVINFGGKKWDAPLSLREMYGEQWRTAASACPCAPFPRTDFLNP